MIYLFTYILRTVPLSGKPYKITVMFWKLIIVLLQGFEDLLVFDDCMNKYHDNFGSYSNYVISLSN